MSKPTRYNVLGERKLTSAILSRRVNFISVWPELVSMLVPLLYLEASAEAVQGTLSMSHGHISLLPILVDPLEDQQPQGRMGPGQA